MAYTINRDRYKTNYNRFKPAVQMNDTDVSIRTFSGRMTKGRWKIINRFCRARSYRIPVYSDYDCTGQLCGHYMSFQHRQNQTTITLERLYDY